MGYIKKTYIAGNTIEVEKIYSFRYKGKNTKRGPRVKPTPEAMKKINERNAFKKLRRIINANFNGDSFHMTVTYRPGCFPEDAEQAKKDIAKFWRQLKKLDKNLKYVAVAEHTKNGNIHFHIVLKVNASTKQIQECWPNGNINFRVLEPGGDYEALAWYLLKETSKTYFDKARRVFGKRWCESKNLIHPVPRVEKIKADSWRNTPSAPKGYYVIQDSITSGVTELTGWPFQYYRCMKLEPEEKKGYRYGHFKTKP